MVMVSIIILSVFMLSVIMLSVTMLSVIMLSGVMLSGIILHVSMLTMTAHFQGKGHSICMKVSVKIYVTTVYIGKVWFIKQLSRSITLATNGILTASQGYGF